MFDLKTNTTLSRNMSLLQTELILAVKSETTGLSLYGTVKQTTEAMKSFAMARYLCK